ncbi:MAG TPA: helix-turn-helix transcriptional regulator, partial [Phycisphaerae bacterium]|nr:helix-turn-helix transcriptional regulator [Phycisphaerae bacterium]
MPDRNPAIEKRAAETLGQRVRRRRRELHLSQTDLAELANVNQGYISEIERDRRNPSRRTIRALAVALDT